MTALDSERREIALESQAVPSAVGAVVPVRQPRRESVGISNWFISAVRPKSLSASCSG